MQPPAPSGTVCLDLATGAEAVRLARLAGADLAARAGFDVEQIDDLCQAIEELCTAIVGGPPGEGRLRLRFELEASALTIEGTGTGSVQCRQGDARRRLLDAVLDQYALGGDGLPSFRARKTRGGQP